MHIEYQISEDDFVNAGKLALRTRSNLSRVRAYVVPIMAYSLIGLAVLISILTRQFAVGSPLLLWGVVLLFSSSYLRGYTFRRVYRKSPLMREPRTLDVDDTHLRFATAVSDSRSPWQAYIRYAESDQTFILFQQGNQIFIPIPKRSLSPDQIVQLRSFFETHIARG